MALAMPALAADAAAAQGSDQLEEVQVTGTRIKRATDFDTANPTTVIDSDYFQNLGIVNKVFVNRGHEPTPNASYNFTEIRDINGLPALVGL